MLHFISFKQIWSTALKISWDVKDEESYVVRQHISIKTDHNVENTIPAVQVIKVPAFN